MTTTGTFSHIPLARRATALTGADGWRTAALDAAGLPALALSDGPSGVRGGSFGTEADGTLLPNATALAASWDESLVARAGMLLGREARRAGIDWLLAPVLNLHRTPFGGRHFECFSEDPHLTSEIGVAIIRGIQSAGVSATAKHFVGNESETGRLEYDARIDERTLRELYLAPFEAAVRRGGVDAVMAAYNSVNGTRATEDRRLLTDILRGEWGFRGAVVSDWGAARTTTATAEAGVDLVMPGPDGPWGDALVDAVRDGLLPERVIDEKLAALTTVARRREAIPAPSDEDADELLVTLAAEGMVLLENDGVLPLAHADRIALIGPGATDLTLQGGGSARVRPVPTRPLGSELADLLGPSTSIVVEPGTSIRRTLAPLADARVPGGLRVTFERADGTVAEVRTLRHGDIVFDDAVPSDAALVRVSTRLHLPEPGVHQLGIRGNGRFSARIADAPAETFTLPVPDRDPLSPLVEPAEHRVAVHGGADVDIDVTLLWDPAAEWHLVDLGHAAPAPEDDDPFDRAVRAAAGADVAIVVVGTTAEHESEGFDRDSLSLPGRQDDLVRAVSAVCARTVVVVNAGSPVLLPWWDQVSAVLWAWFPGQGGARAIAECLRGVREPGGRLPTAIPRTIDGLPSVRPIDGMIQYAERERFGTRGPAAVHYPLGHGLGYTAWRALAASARRDESAGDDGVGVGATVEAIVRNTGARTGKHVVQVFLETADEAPRLVGFAPVVLPPCAEATVSVPLRPEALRRWHHDGWRALTGPLRLLVGGHGAPPLPIDLAPAGIQTAVPPSTDPSA
ncbi:beta-glucosidase [Microbacterium resistens]|uniref:Beta-glucosidase n=1 Tax=Microbacterium resistens TaxID=156977 RepID=A0ABU1SHV1_9MICO|nr:glycoside hydrolase family 3 N-terminal domain-containing protein [Microbacterium resistens]MDR6868598.1 beta-glucosidase [Microbacterium resistens]